MATRVVGADKAADGGERVPPLRTRSSDAWTRQPGMSFGCPPRTRPRVCRRGLPSLDEATQTAVGGSKSVIKVYPVLTCQPRVPHYGTNFSFSLSKLYLA